MSSVLRAGSGERSFAPARKRPSDRDSLAYDEELRRRGRYLVAEALDPVSRARTIRLRRGKRAVTDGPFAETKEHLGGFILVDAADMNEALDLAG